MDNKKYFLHFLKSYIKGCNMTKATLLSKNFTMINQIVNFFSSRQTQHFILFC